MNNQDVAAAMREIGELLELKGESAFKIRAYDNAARLFGGLTVDVRDLVATGKLKSLKGVGDAIAKKVEELVTTGHMQYLDGLRQEFPPGVRTFLNIPGVGPSLARRLYTELGITTVEELREAASDGRLAVLPGLGEKSAANVLRGLDRVNKEDTRISMGTALPLVEELMGELRGRAPMENLMPAGSLRRWSPTIGDIDMMATSDDASAVMDAFIHLPQVAHVLGHGPTKSAIVSDNGLQVDLRIVERKYFGSLLQHFTGSRAHNIELREYALARGLSLNEYGITDVNTKQVMEFADEESFYGALGLQYIPPELREGRGEIQAARAYALPSLVTVQDVRGDLHAHTNWSDGSQTIEEMICAARERGYEYVAITDHSPSTGVAGGLSVERLVEHTEAVRRAAEQFEDIHVLAGAEVDIKRDGTLDYPDDVLAELDWVVASVHSGFNQDEEQMTARIIRAIENPYVHALGHPTGRLIGKRQPYAVNLEAMFEAAARTGTALEINSFPERLDLVDTHARRAIELGIMLVVNTDAHAAVHYDNIRYGIAMARRAWAEPRNVLNTRPYAELRAWLRSALPLP